MNLVIVESPNKIKKVAMYLKSAYPNQSWVVKASVGHITDLDDQKGSVEKGVDADFNPVWKVSSDKRKVVSDLKDWVQKAQTTFIATDPDREGEAIAYHLIQQLKLSNKYKRITFGEISEAAIRKAVENAGELDSSLVNAAFARRVIDRIYGYKGSSVFKNLVENAKSIGRVQTAVLNQVVMRDQEIANFQVERYQTTELVLEGKSFKLLDKDNPDKQALFNWQENKEQFSSLSETLNKIKWYKVQSVKLKTKTVSPPLPLSMSDVLKKWSHLYSSKELERALQKLFEEGLISYPRTDARRLETNWVATNREIMQKQDLSVGKDLVKSSGGDQDAHESIRPVSMQVNSVNTNSETANHVYQLIYEHYLQVLGDKATDEVTDVVLENQGSAWKASFVNTKELGWRQNVKQEMKTNELKLEEGTQVVSFELVTSEKQTTPPPRFNEGSLVSMMEKTGIGRPSTYATVVQTLFNREYICKEQKAVVATPLGKSLIAKTQKHLEGVIETEFTKEMEKALDDIAKNKNDKTKVIKHFYELFGNKLKQIPQEEFIKNIYLRKCPDCEQNTVKDITDKNDITYEMCVNKECSYTTRPANYLEKLKEKTQEINLRKFGKCAKCDFALREVRGKFGRFLSCSNYPTCKYIRK